MPLRDHGGGIDAARARFGGARIDWVDLSTGINPVPYPVPDLAPDHWTALPDTGAFDRLHAAARSFWCVPDSAEILCAAGASAIISRCPALFSPQSVRIPGPTYNEHAAAFSAQGWQVVDDADAEALVIVHPNNPDGRLWDAGQVLDRTRRLLVIDESFCDVCPERSLMPLATERGTIVLKSFGKFWGLAGLRLGFAIGDPEMIARLRELLGPWAVSGPALAIGARALTDCDWAAATRTRLEEDSRRLDRLMNAAGAETIGGTTLFRLYRVDDAARWQERLAEQHIWTRAFPYNSTWLRLGLPHPDYWPRIEAALG